MLKSFMPMKELKIFENPQFGEIRTSGTSDEPMFCLSDVCKALGLGNVTEVKKRLSPPFISTIEVGVRTGKKSDGSPAIQQTQMIFIGEPNLYKCIFQSRKKEAEAFQDWVCKEVLPSIRKTGGYIAASPDDTPEMIMAKALKVADATMRRQDAELKAAKSTLETIKEAIRESTAALEKANRLLYGEPEAAKPVAVDAKALPRDPDAYTGSQWVMHGLRGASDLLGMRKIRCRVSKLETIMVREGYLEEMSYANEADKQYVMKCRRLTEEGKKFGRNKLFPNCGRYLPLYYDKAFTRLIHELREKGYEL